MLSIEFSGIVLGVLLGAEVIIALIFSIVELAHPAGSWAMSVAAGPDKIVALSTENSSETMFVLVSPHLAEIWLTLGHVLFVTSLFAALLAFHNTAARYTFALGRERVLFSWFGATGRRFRAPIWGSITQSILAVVVLAVFALSDGLDPFIHLFFWWTVTGGFGVLILMTVTSVAVLVYFLRNREGELAEVSPWRRFIAPAIGAVLLAAVLVVTVLEFETLLGVKPDDPARYLFPGLFLAAALIGAGWAAFLRTGNPTTYRGIGQGVNAALLPAEPEAAAAHRAGPR